MEADARKQLNEGSHVLSFGNQFSVVFQDLPEPNRAWLLGVYVVAPRPLLSLYGIIYVTWYTRHLPKPTGVRFW